MARKTLPVSVAIAFVLGAAALAQGELPPLIPREVLFGNPVKAAPQISPDGARLSFLAPSPEGVLNVWVRTVGKDDDVQVTRDTHRGIRTHFLGAGRQASPVPAGRRRRRELPRLLGRPRQRRDPRHDPVRGDLAPRA